MKPTCKQCGDVLRGRTDKQYCDDQCRSAFHNAQNSNSTNFMRTTHRIMRRNWKVLHRFENDGIHELPLIEAQKQGFNEDVVTGIYRANGQMLYRCYEYSFEVREGKVLYFYGDEGITPVLAHE